MLLRIFLTVSTIALVLVAAHWAIDTFGQHVFDPDVLHRIAKEAVSQHQTPEEIIAHVVAAVSREYPDHIMTENPFILNAAGGALGAMKVLHCSLSEYIIIFGSPTGTEGHSGRHFADDYFHILFGEQWAAAPGQLTYEKYVAGDQHLMKRGVAKQYRLPGTAWALEYARGDIVSMFPFGLFDSIFSTIDVVTIWETVYYSAIGMTQELLQGKI